MAPVIGIRFSPPEFGRWLQGLCSEAGIETPRQLLKALNRHCDDDIGEKTVERWFKGSHAPRDVDPILVTFSALLGADRTLASYEAFMQDEFDRLRSFQRSLVGAGDGAHVDSTAPDSESGGSLKAA